MKLNAIVYNKTRKFAGHTVAIEVEDNATIADVKKAIEGETLVPESIQWIIFGVRNLPDSAVLADHGIQSGYTIYSVPTYIEIQEIPNL